MEKIRELVPSCIHVNIKPTLGLLWEHQLVKSKDIYYT